MKSKELMTLIAKLRSFGTAFFCSILAIVATSVASGQTTRSYHIGNSLTVDGRTHLLRSVAANAGQTIISGRHILCNSTMQQIIASPTSTCLTPDQYGYFNEALPDNDWDAITVQPFQNSTETNLADDLASIETLKQLAESEGRNINTKYYVYQSWPKSFEFEEVWESEATNAPSQLTTPSKEYYEVILGELQADYGDQFRTIPTAAVLARVREMIIEGDLAPIVGQNEIYRDAVHLSEFGRFIANTTLFSTITATSPVGLPILASWTDDVPASLIGTLQEAIWQVVATTPGTGVVARPTGDFDLNGVVDNEDFAIWRSGYGSSDLSADANGDGIVDAADYTRWRAFYGTGVSSAASFSLAIPEPTSGVLILAALLIVFPIGFPARNRT